MSAHLFSNLFDVSNIIQTNKIQCLITHKGIKTKTLSDMFNQM